MNRYFSFTIIHIVLCLFLIVNVFAQGNWEQILPPGPTSNQMVSLYFVDENTGWSAGEHGTILKTMDGGESWSLIEIPWMTYLLDIFFVNNSVGYTVGQDGLILKSTDGGENWVQLENQYINNLNRTIFKDENKGWTIGEKGLILFTSDGGENWIQQISNVGEDLHGICFLGENDLCIVGDNFTILKSTIGTDTWQLINFEPGPFDQNSTYNFCDVYFLNETHGWMAGEKGRHRGTIIQTQNGGERWVELEVKLMEYRDYFAHSRSSSGTSTGLQQIFFLDHENGFFLTQPQEDFGITTNLPYFTNNGGKTWTCNMYGTFENSGKNGRLFWLSNNRIINTGFQGEFRYAENDFDKWYFPNASTRTFSDFFIGNNGVLLGIRYKAGAEFPHADLAFSRSIDFGKSWNDFVPQYFDSIGIEFTPDRFFTNISCIKNSNTLWAFDYDWTNEKSVIYESTDLGLTWNYSHLGCHWFSQVISTDTLILYQLDQVEVTPEVYQSKIVFTNSMDGGKTKNIYHFNGIWNDILLSNQAWTEHRFISDSYFINGKTGFLVGSEGNIIKTKDTGQSWKVINSGVVEHLWDIEFINRSTGFVVGDFGRILKSEDSGEHWHKTNSGTQDNIYSIAFLNELQGWAGTQSGMLYTADGGENWQGVPLRYQHGLIRHIKFDKNGNGYAYSANVISPYALRDRFWRRPGGYSYLLSWKNSTVHVEKLFDDIGIPQYLILKQNYPNPFNSSTKIYYNLSKSSIVKLNIFNLNGQIVRELVNISQIAGEHSVVWDGLSNSGIKVSSGVYIYSIEANQQIQTKKMLYLR